MATVELRDKLFDGSTLINIWVDGLRLESYSYDGETLTLRAIETVDFDKEKHMYYEWEISPEMWNNGTVVDNIVTVEWGTGHELEIMVTVEMPVDLKMT